MTPAGPDGGRQEPMTLFFLTTFAHIFFWEGEASHEELRPQIFYPRSLLFNVRLSILYFLYPREQLVPTLVFNLYPTGHLITHLRRLLSYLINEELWQVQEFVDVL